MRARNHSNTKKQALKTVPVLIHLKSKLLESVPKVDTKTRLNIPYFAKIIINITP